MDSQLISILDFETRQHSLEKEKSQITGSEWSEPIQ